MTGRENSRVYGGLTSTGLTSCTMPQKTKTAEEHLKICEVHEVVLRLTYLIIRAFGKKPDD